jgi:hypothetical protein
MFRRKNYCNALMSWAKIMQKQELLQFATVVVVHQL